VQASHGQWLARFFVTTSTVALLAMPVSAAAQEAAADDMGDEIVVSGIRASLDAAANIKRAAQGVVDAISAEDMGKFPDTNLAESLQRITGVSIDRSNGEGSFVTVRGFGPDFNLVTLNGRQMPTASLGDCCSAPSSRSFDFANLASEGVAGIEVYKTGRAAVATGGIGSSINIRTPRPLDRKEFEGSIAVKGVIDSSQNSGTDVTPEVSGIISKTFFDGRFGILLNGVYQKRKASVNQANVGWLDAVLGGNVAGTVTNAPGPDDVYARPQNASYDLTDINRERINGQLVLQAKPTDNLTATVDYIYSSNKVTSRTSSTGVWFNNQQTTSEWLDGPVAGPLFYSEAFGPGKDLSYSGSMSANRTINRSLGANLTWEAPGGVTVEMDYHHSTATSKPTNQYGSSTSLGAAVFGVANQSVDFSNYIPVISVGMNPGVDAMDPSLITATGNSFRNGYFRNAIDQVQLRGSYDHNNGVLDGIDFGVSYINSRVRSAYGYRQQDTWGGAGPASDLPDDMFTKVSIADKFAGLGGANNPNMLQNLYVFNFERMAGLIDDLYGACEGTGNCLAPYSVDRSITEKTLSPYVQVRTKFDVGSRPAHLTAGVRYDHTSIDSAALVPVPVSTVWVSQNELIVRNSPDSQFTRFKGEYQNWLPAIDFDIEPVDNVKLRASYSHTLTRANYDSLQGGRTIDQLFRTDFATGSQGNPGLLPYKSKNIDVSAEWYYGRSSYVSAGYFRKNVSNFISQTRLDTPAFGLTNPAAGPRYDAAVAALGANASMGDIRDYIFTNYPNSTVPVMNGADFARDEAGFIKGDILGLAEDDAVNFLLSTPVNSDQKAVIDGWEFAVQHSFWDTGFGVQLNYTMVQGDAEYNNMLPASATQFALVGLSDSANAVAYYEKNGLQARVAWNWRDKFLAGSGPNPTYVEEYWQIDASASYEFRPGLTGFVEAINLTGESRRGHRRSENEVTFAAPGYARYAAGVRFSF
jgi:TonB-dependent receptor